MSDVSTQLADVTESLSGLADRVRSIEEMTQAACRLAAAGVERPREARAEVERLRTKPEWNEAFAADPLISVRIATFNRATEVTERALASVRRQTYTRWEAVVVGDCCTDDTGEKIAAIGDNRIRFVNLPVRGPYPDDERQRWLVAGIPAMNVATELANGQWIAPLDDDDEFDDDHVEVLLDRARETRAEVAYGRLLAVQRELELEALLGEWPPRLGEFGFQGALYHAGLRWMAYDPACRFLDEPGDWNLARRMWEAGVRFTYVDRTVTTYNVVRSDDAVVGWFRHQQSKQRM
jgi:glycosyltransferase involved in cell wall biosynthesis